MDVMKQSGLFAGGSSRPILPNWEDSKVRQITFSTLAGLITVLLFLAGCGKGDTDLHVAAKAGRIETVRKYVEARTPPIDVRNKLGKTPLYYAVWGNQLGVVKYLVESGAAVNAADPHGTIPLHAAAEAGGPELVSFLLEHGADVNAKGKNGYTPLHAAAIWNNVPMAKLLLEHGANPSAKMTDGATPLDLARKWGRQDVQAVLAHP
jgi:ankyrin repeat protein